MIKSLFLSCVLCLCVAVSFCKKSDTVKPKGQPIEPTINVALAGNAFITTIASGGKETINDQGLTNWTNAESITSTYFRLGQKGKLTVQLKAKVATGSSTVKVTVNGTPFTVNLSGSNYTTYTAGTINITELGYVKIDFQGISKTGNSFADVSDVIISGSSTTSNVILANDPANYYWSRRGPSVHMSYPTPTETETEWFYNELTVPLGEDKIGSYYMANGFGEGYFGIQVNSESERRILFSVWDPSVGKTTLVKKGPNVVDNSFGGEGTGGQSYMLYNWNAGTTYKFLTHAKPDGSGNTLYSAWFYAPELNSWKFIATWKRPNTTTYLKGLYSFLENFHDYGGYLGRKVNFNNQWAKSTTGVWTELTQGKFTCDATGTNKQRLDFAGGIENGQFFLKNGGFFAAFVNANTNFTRPATGQQPTVDLTTLP